MTIKKDKILEVALKLFANFGYANTSTSKIAKSAEVSEGLIFRHYENKEGLLDAIVEIGNQDIEDFYLRIQNEKDPKKIISEAIDFPITIMNKNKDYWQLVSSLKYQSPEIAAKYHNSEIINQLKDILIKAFATLNYKYPEMEAGYLFLIIIGLSTSIKKECNDNENQNMVKFIKSKYKI